MCTEHYCVYSSLSGVNRRLFSLWVWFDVVWSTGEVLLKGSGTQDLFFPAIKCSLCTYQQHLYITAQICWLNSTFDLWPLYHVGIGSAWKTYLQLIVFVLTGWRCHSGGINCSQSGFDFYKTYQIDFQTIMHGCWNVSESFVLSNSHLASTVRFRL